MRKIEKQIVETLSGLEYTLKDHETQVAVENNFKNISEIF